MARRAEEAGYAHHADTVALAPPERRRPLGVLTAAREPLTPLEPPAVPWPERILVTAHGDLQIVNLHSPIAPAPELAKIRTHEAVAAYLDARPHSPRILCGDLNTPRREHADGSVLTFAHDSAAAACAPSAASAGTPPSARSSTRCATSTAGSTRSARSTATSTARRAGRSRRTAAAGGSTTCSCTA